MVELDPPGHWDEPDSLLPRAGRLLGKCLKFPSELATEDKIDWDFDWVASPKLDGNRCLILNGQIYSSSMRPIRNQQLTKLLAPALERSLDRSAFIDLEIYDPEGDHHAQLSGALNSYNDPLTASTMCYAFDAGPMSSFEEQCTGMPFGRREEFLHTRFTDCGLTLAVHQRVPDWSSAQALFAESIADGKEGLILRSRNTIIINGKLTGGWYKHGRSTVSQQLGFKMKLYNTVDGVITKVIQRRVMKSGIERTLNPDGTLARVNSVDAYTLTDMVGAFEVAYWNPETEQVEKSEIGFGKGFDHTAREDLWNRRESIVGQWVEFLSMPHGSKDKIRHGRLVRFRHDKHGNPGSD